MDKNNITLSPDGVSILSLFDGMSCGMIAMLSAGLKVKSYDAYEGVVHKLERKRGVKNV